ncbi:CRISPR-associated endoribonuclease Cas6 [Allochromatium warmingii]|uniref:CRISPR-associated endoribonuclease Cas6 n=1 Tax=Allochromatium warmingii TaxID=61595 RepID=A0A1H3J187_ALLWA|nr:CRISPR-associated endoribonuclease Cas6 [Allochromatium warmingii]SDY33773.1 CRISPR-associated endoribonuclease Cas6 [Allochromatium warmingii]
MYRLRLQLPPGRWAHYRYLDLIHDALVNAWIAAGAQPEQVIGAQALPWNFAPLGFHSHHEGRAHTLVVSTPDATLSTTLATIDPCAVRYARAATGEMLDFSSANVVVESSPILAEQTVLGVLTLSPVAISDLSKPTKRWHTSLDEVDLSAVVNSRLSRISGRQISLTIQPDSLYLRANPRHSVVVSTKRMKNGQPAFVIGMQAPLVVSGHRADALLAWYAGLGEKTRNGFGCIGLAEGGVGR